MPDPGTRGQADSPGPKRTALVTYCAAAKRPDPGHLPAVERYLSDRIARVGSAAAILGYDFFILSGRFGLLAPLDPIPAYDHLLTVAEAAAHARLVAGQLGDRGVGSVVFFSRPVAVDPGVAAYRLAAEEGCRLAGVEYHLVEWG